MNRRMRAVFLLLLAGAAGGASPGGAQTRAPLVVGVVENTGSLVPVAAFDGTAWSSPWPQGAAPLDAPSGSGPIPPAWTAGVDATGGWTLWLEGGPVPLADAGLTESVTACSANLAIATNAPRRADDCGNCCPKEKLGIATAGGRPPALPTAVDLAGPEALVLLDALAPLFENLEGRAVAEEIQRQGEPRERRLPYTGQYTDAARRDEGPISIQEAWSLADLLYIEIKKDYLSTRDIHIACPGISQLRGWFRRAPGGTIETIEAKVGLFDCDAKGASFDEPMGAWPHASGVDVLVRRLGWEIEDFALLTVGDSDVVEGTLFPFRR